MKAVNASEIDCDNQNNIICYYEEAEKIALLHDESDDYLDDEIYIRAQEYYNNFLNYVENNNHSFENNTLISAYINVARVNSGKNKFSDFDLIKKNIINYNKAFELGAGWSLSLSCDTLMEAYYWNISDNIDGTKKEKLDDYLKTARDLCEKFINEKHYKDNVLDINNNLYKFWSPSKKESELFNVYYNLMWAYENLDNSLKSIENAFKAEEAYNLKKEWDLDELQTESLSKLYNLLGYSYESNYGVKNNPARAIYYYELSADLNNRISIENLAEIYLTGKYGELNFLKAISYYNKALEVDSLATWPLFYLGEIYLYGFGVDIDAKKAKLYFDRLVENYNYLSDNSEDYYPLKIENAENSFYWAQEYLTTWDEKENTHNSILVCNNAQENHFKGYHSFHLFQACKDLADRNLLGARKKIIDFYAYGVVVPKNASLAFQMAEEFIKELEEVVSGKNWSNFLYSKNITDYTESDYVSDYLDMIELLKYSNASLIFWGDINNQNPQIAYRYIDQIIKNNKNYLNPLDNPNLDLWYSREWFMYNLMKIDGWGTQKDLESVGVHLDKLKNNLIFLKNNPEDLDEFNTSDEVKDALKQLDYVSDKYKQAKSGYLIKSKILFAFPATYSGQTVWKHGFNQSIEIDIKDIKRTGYEVYNVSGSIKYINIEDPSINEQYLLSGDLDSSNGMISFEELDTGDDATLDSEYGKGMYYGKFNPDYSSFIGEFVYYNEEGHAHVEVFKEENLAASVDYKKSIGIGKQYALLIGNNDYENLSKLETATADARSLADVLQNKYGFIVESPLINATRNEILMKLSYLSNALNPDDSLLIFYAGHGRQDEDTGRGYWSPIDAYADNFINDISNDDITNILKKINSKHILVIADSCYSGTLVLRGNSPVNKVNDISYLKELARKESRKALTSGALQPVSDTGENGHSAFANSLLKVLVENEKIISANELHQNIRPLIMSKYSQTPLYNVVGNAGDEGGEFLFVPIQ